MTIRDAIGQASGYLARHGLRTPREDAAVLVAAVVARSRAFLLAHPEFELSEEQRGRLEGWLRRRGDHYPIQYLTGFQEFYGRLFRVTPAVLIPRPETELLVEVTLELLSGISGEALGVIDVGTGSGCIAISIALQDPRVRVTAVDICESALQVARENARRLAPARQIVFVRGDALEPFAGGTPDYHIVVSNPPYIEDNSESVDLSVRLFEPAEALFAGPSGLELYEKLFQGAIRLLRADGALVVELAYGMLDRVRELADRERWKLIEVRPDLAGIPRCAVFRPAS